MVDNATLAVEHETLYRYDWPVELAHHLAFLRPLQDAHQRLLQFEVEIDPPPAQQRSDRDAFGNGRSFFSVTQSHQALRVRARSRVALRTPPAPRPAASPPWEAVRERLAFRAGARFEPAAEFVAPSPYVPRLPALRDYARPSFTPGRPLAEAALELMHRIHADFRYASASTSVDTPLAEVLQQRRGVCQDFAHLMIGALRSHGLAARYVSGYLLTRAADGAATLQGADASHAWLALWCPGIHADPAQPAAAEATDWLQLDPTNDMLPQLTHVRVAQGRDYGDVTPLRGVIRGGGRHALAVHVHTERL